MLNYQRVHVNHQKRRIFQPEVDGWLLAVAALAQLHLFRLRSDVAAANAAVAAMQWRRAMALSSWMEKWGQWGSLAVGGWYVWGWARG